jgi:hypothetical protein
MRAVIYMNKETGDDYHIHLPDDIEEGQISKFARNTLISQRKDPNRYVRVVDDPDKALGVVLSSIRNYPDQWGEEGRSLLEKIESGEWKAEYVPGGEVRIGPREGK